MPSQRLLSAAPLLGLALAWGSMPARAAPEAAPQTESATAPVMAPAAASAPAPADHSGRIGRGAAAVLSAADAGRYDPRANSVASSTLPKGATARVTNIGNGRSTIVLVQEHRPAPKGEIIEVSQRVAQLLGMKSGRTTRVQVAPLAVPQANGSIRLGRGTALAGRRAYVTEPVGSTARR